MTKFDIENFDPVDSHSINISVYKPDGILSFWNWFRRRSNKSNESQRKNIKFKINKEDLDKIKLSGFDVQKLQTLAGCNKSTRQSNVFAIPKTDLDQFLMKSLHQGVNTRTYVKRLISKSTISIRSKESCANLKYVRTVRSQKSVVNSNTPNSKTSFKLSMRSNTNVHFANHHQRNVLLKSVPTTILKSNTKKLLILGNMKSPKVNRTARNNVLENLNNQYPKENSNVIPTLLTRMKSMEEHLSDIEQTTKKINEAVSQRNVVTKSSSKNNVSNTEGNRTKAVKWVASHKIYSKNIHAPRKNKKNRPKKSRNKSKINVMPPKEACLEPKLAQTRFAFNYFSDSSNELKQPSDLGHVNISHKKPGLYFDQHGFTFPNNISKLEFSPENDNSNVGCDFIMSVVKALTEAKGSTNLKQMDISMSQDKPQYPNIGAEVGVTDLSKGNVMSKSKFDWKHASVSTSSEPQIIGTGKSNQENVKVKKNISVNFGKQNVSHIARDSNDILNQIFSPNHHKKLVLEMLGNNNSMSLQQQDKTETIGGTKTLRSEESVEVIKFPSPDLEPADSKGRVTKEAAIEVQNNASTHSCLNKQNSAHSNRAKESHTTDSSKLNVEHLQLFPTVETHQRFNENDTLTDFIERPGSISSVEKTLLNLQSGEENNHSSEFTIDQGRLCSVSIKQNSFSTRNSPGKLFKRTTIGCSNAQKEPKVSITILVQDSMKDEVEMKSNLLKDTEVSKEEPFDRSRTEKHLSPVSSCGPRGDQLSTVQSNLSKTESLCSLEHFSCVSCAASNREIQEPVPNVTVERNPYSRTNKNFYVEVEDNGRRTLAEEALNLGSPGTYLNHEKRKVLEDKVLGFKQYRPVEQPVCEKEPLSLTRSCSNISNGLTSFDHLIETSFIRQETSYSKTKFNFSKENKYNSRPLERCSRSPFSDESLNTGNNYDISTKYTTQQCVMYCRNNNVANFRRPTFPHFQETPSKTTKLEKRYQPFVLLHSLNNKKDSSVVDTNNQIPKVRQKGIALNFREDPILEVPEEESIVENLVLNEQETHKSDNDIATETSHESLRNSLKQSLDTKSGSVSDVVDDKDWPNRSGQKVQNGNSQTENEHSDATEGNLQRRNTSLKCDCGAFLDYESEDACLKSSEPINIRTTLTSRISQTALSSTLVQTDWSLVGITVDHLNRSNNKSEPTGSSKRTVASQTDVMMDQIALVNKDLDEMNICCKSCMKNSQFSELVACDVTVSQAKSLPEATIGSKPVTVSDLELKVISDMLVAEFQEKERISLYFASSTLPIKEDFFRSDLFELVQTPTLLKPSSKIRNPSCKLRLDQAYSKSNSEESMTNVSEGFPHLCSIPCLTTLSDETEMSGLSECSHKIISKGIQGYLTAPQVHAINSGCISSYNDSSEPKCPPNLLSATEENRASTCGENSAFCTVIRDLELSLNDNCAESQTFLGESDAARYSTLGRLNASMDCPGVLEVGVCEPLTEEIKLKRFPETKKENDNTKVQRRKTGLKTHRPTKARKIGVSSVNKCTDYTVNHIRIDRCGDEGRGNSVFSHT